MTDIALERSRRVGRGANSVDHRLPVGSSVVLVLLGIQPAAAWLSGVR